MQPGCEGICGRALTDPSPGLSEQPAKGHAGSSLFCARVIHAGGASAELHGWSAGSVSRRGKALLPDSYKSSSKPGLRAMLLPATTEFKLTLPVAEIYSRLKN